MPQGRWADRHLGGGGRGSQRARPGPRPPGRRAARARRPGSRSDRGRRQGRPGAGAGRRGSDGHGGRCPRHRFRGRGARRDAGPRPHRLQHGQRRGKALARVGCQSPSRDGAQREWQFHRPDGREIGASPGQRLQHDGPDRVQVGLHGGGPSGSPLRRQVAGSAKDDAGHRHVVADVLLMAAQVEALGNAEVRDLRVAVVVQEDVAGLDVPVQDAHGVRGRQSRERLGQDLHDPRCR